MFQRSKTKDRGCSWTATNLDNVVDILLGKQDQWDAKCPYGTKDGRGQKKIPVTWQRLTKSSGPAMQYLVDSFSGCKNEEGGYFSQQESVITVDPVGTSSMKDFHLLQKKILVSSIVFNLVSSLVLSLVSNLVSILVFSLVASVVSTLVSSLVLVSSLQPSLQSIPSLVYNLVVSLVYSIVLTRVYSQVSSLIFSLVSSLVFGLVSSLVLSKVSSLVSTQVSSLVFSLVSSLASSLLLVQYSL